MIKKIYKKGNLVKFVKCKQRDLTGLDINKDDLDDNVGGFEGFGLVLKKEKNDMFLEEIYYPVYTIFVKNRELSFSFLDIEEVK